MPLRLITIATAALASIAACDRSPADHLHSLQAECGRDARSFANTYVAEYRRKSPRSSSGMISHYSQRDHRCYAHVWLDSEYEAGDQGLFHKAVLVDVDENREIGVLSTEVALHDGQRIDVPACSVRNKKCSSEDEWAALIKPYMEQ
jgi:hypothetical protein